MPLTKTFAATNVEEQTAVLYQHRALTWMMELLERDSTIEWPKFTETAPERENILKLIDWGLTKGFYQDTLETIRLLHWHLWSRGYWNEATYYLATGIRVAEQQGDLEFLAILKQRLVTIKGLEGNSVRAIALAEEVIRLSREVDHKLREIDAWRSLGMIFLKEGETIKARGALEQSLALAHKLDQNEPKNEHDTEKIIAYIYNNLAEVSLREDKLTEANLYLDKSQEIAEKLCIEISLAMNCLLRGELAYARANLDEAEDYFKSSLKLSRQLKSYLYEGYANHALAKVGLAQRKYHIARERAQVALEIFTKLGMHKEVVEVQQLIDKNDRKVL